MLTYNERNTQEQSIFYVTAQIGPAVVKGEKPARR